MTDRFPDFLIIGAQKCATTTLHEQLAHQSTIFMSSPKEPMFFSDPKAYRQARDSYCGLFTGASEDQLCGESSTGYTMLPDRPGTVERIRDQIPQVRMIYLIRHPIDRLISHYIHDWTQREISGGIERAINNYPPLINYGRYAMQLDPYLETFGPERILLVFFDRLRKQPQSELERVGRFLGVPEPLVWHEENASVNVSAERMRQSKLRDVLVYAPGISQVRQRLPQTWRDGVKRLWRKRRRPELSPATRQRLTDIFNEDLGTLGMRLGCPLSCSNFANVAMEHSGDWNREEVTA